MTSRVEHAEKTSASVLLVGLSLLVGTPFFAVGFMLSYFMNGMANGRDHLTFAVAMSLCTVVAGGIGAGSLRARRWPRGASLRFGYGIALAVTGTFLAAFFVWQAPVMGADPTFIFGAWTTGQIRAFALLWAVVAGAGITSALTARRR